MNREKNDSQGFIRELLEDHETIIMNLRENIEKFDKKFHDAGSTDFITGLMENHEKMAWFLRANIVTSDGQMNGKTDISKRKKQAATV
jgi:starvation-inducible DNA-binding protein